MTRVPVNLTPARPATQAEFNARMKALDDLMLTALRSDLHEARGWTEEQAYAAAAAEAKCLAACCKPGKVRNELLATAREFAQ